MTESNDIPTDASSIKKAIPSNTTLAVVATNVNLEKSQLIKVSELAHDGFARAVMPIHSMMDGDVIFSVSTSGSECIDLKNVSKNFTTDYIGLIAANLVGKTISSLVIDN